MVLWVDDGCYGDFTWKTYWGDNLLGAQAPTINYRGDCRFRKIVNDEQIDVVANTIMDAINYAAALDLDRRPRLSRTNAGK